MPVPRLFLLAAPALLAAACAPPTVKPVAKPLPGNIVARTADCAAEVASVGLALPSSAQPIRPSMHNENPPFPADSGVPRVGRARVAFVVDTTGRPDIASIEVTDASHPAFAAAVRSVVPTWRFRAARLRPSNCPVPARYERVVEFERDESTDPKEPKKKRVP